MTSNASVSRPRDANEERFEIHAPASMQDGTSRVLKSNETFAIFDRHANVPKFASSHGVYHRGARHLSELWLTINGLPLLLLGSSVCPSNTVLVVDLSNPELTNGEGCIAHSGELHVRRTCFLVDGVCFEKLEIANFRAHPVSFRLAYSFSADFVDIFEVRGTHRLHRGTRQEPEVGTDEVVLGYQGLDDVLRRTHLQFSPAPDVLGPRVATFNLTLEPQQSKELFLTIGCAQQALPLVGSSRLIQLASPMNGDAVFQDALARTTARENRHRESVCSIYTDSEPFNTWIDRSTADLFMMLSDTPHGLYPYAGVPWFSAPFGRDGILTAVQACWAYPEIAAGVLRFLAHYQATEEDTERDAEPGKILHEMRYGEMAALREVPFGRYYGSIDATPLFLMLAGVYFDITHDVETLEALFPALERALAWIDEYGDRDGDGFVEYGRRNPRGLLHQGWKDSHDSVWHADGRDAEGPIALCEVQGYVYAAWQAVARIANALGRIDVGRRCSRHAETLRTAFDDAFWCEDIGMYAMALDGRKKQCRVRSSNAGHCLWSGIALPHRAEVMEETLLSDAMFSGWGIRTIARGELRFNPMSYHNGSVWPHDTALVGEGLARYGFKRSANRIFEALCGVSEVADLNRLPELLCGFAREPGRAPIGYPVACAPQAWSAAAVFSLLRGSLGLIVDAQHGEIRFEQPTLPLRLDQVILKGVRAGPEAMNAHLCREYGDVRVEITRAHEDPLLAVRL